MILPSLEFASIMLHLEQRKLNPYHYTPTEWICATFFGLFIASTVIHLYQAIRYRSKWMIPTAVLCGLLEIVGWGARLKSSFDPTVLLAFEIQTIGTIIGPTPLIAADFMILGRIIQRLGIQYSRLSPKLYSIIFCSFDIVSLTVQGFGATKASLAVHNGTSTKSGANIMLIGIVFQMVTITIYILLATEFFLRYFKDWPIGGKQAEYHELSGGLITSSPLGERNDGRGNFDYPMQIVVGALTFNTTCLFIRAIYRTVELLDGFGGPIISTQRYFNILDGCMIALAITTLNVVHPGVWLKKHDKKESEIEGRLKQAGLLYYRM